MGAAPAELGAGSQRGAVMPNCSRGDGTADSCPKFRWVGHTQKSPRLDGDLGTQMGVGYLLEELQGTEIKNGV